MAHSTTDLAQELEELRHSSPALSADLYRTSTRLNTAPPSSSSASQKMPSNPAAPLPLPIQRLQRTQSTGWTPSTAQPSQTNPGPDLPSPALVKRSFSDVTLERSFRPSPLHASSSGLADSVFTSTHTFDEHPKTAPSEPQDPSAHSMSFTYLPSLFRSSFSIDPPHLEETAEVFGLDQPKDVPKLMKEMGISPWAAVLAVSATTAVSSPPPPPSELDNNRASHEAESHLEHATTVSETSHLERRRTLVNSNSRGFPGGPSKPPPTPHVTFQEEDTKRNFIIQLSRLLFMYGAPSHKLENHLTEVSKALQVDAQFFLLPALVLISFGGETHKSNVHFIKQATGMNMSKLAQVNALCMTLVNGLIDIHSAVERLEAIRSAPDNPWYISLLTFPVSSFCFSLLLFQTTWIESVVAGFLGVIVGALSVFGGQYSGFSFLPEFFGSLISAFVARTLQTPFHNAGICFDYLKVTLAALVIFLPGMSLTISILELSTRNMVSGTVRMFGALFCAMLLGFGMTIGGSLVLWDVSPSTITPVCEPTSQLWAILFFVPMAMSINLLFQGNRHQWPMMTFASAVGYITAALLNTVPQLKAQPTAVNALASAAIGITGNIYSRVTNDVAVAPIFTAVWIQVPGSLSVKSTLGFFGGGVVGTTGGGVVDGIGFTFQMLTISISLALGLFISTMLVWPMKGPKGNLMSI